MPDHESKFLVRPQTLRGMRDILPQDATLKGEIVDRVRRVYELFGYAPLETPVVESLATLLGSGGDEVDNQVFQLETPEKQAAGLRFDLTVPFARVVAQYQAPSVRLPFRRYQIGSVFRADDPQPEQGRYREFTQFDIDVAGTTDISADAEIVSVMSSAFESLGLVPSDGNSAGYQIHLNNRRLMDAFLLGCGISEMEQARQVLRVLDKRSKIGSEALVEELGAGRTDVSGDRIAGVGLSARVIDMVLDFVATEGPDRRGVVEALKAKMAGSSSTERATAEVDELLDHLDAMAVPQGAAVFDPSLARGLAYYTGTVYEGALVGAGVGSVMGGGRYDDLVSRFLEVSIPGVGASIGLDRLVAGLRNLGAHGLRDRAGAEALVLQMPGVERAHASSLAQRLRAAGISTELYVGEDAGRVGKQLSYANSRGFRCAVLAGEDERLHATVTVKDLSLGSKLRAGASERDEYLGQKRVGQLTVPEEDLVVTVRGMLAADL